MEEVSIGIRELVRLDGRTTQNPVIVRLSNFTLLLCCTMLNTLHVIAHCRNKDLRSCPAGWILTLLIAIPAPCKAAGPPSPIALLRGVEQARTEHDSLKATLEIRYHSPQPAKTVNCLVEMVGARRRFEVFAGEVPGQVIIRDDDVFYGFRRKENEDVEIYDLRRATGIRGDLAFDPRALGLSDLMPCDITVKDCLWYEDHEGLGVLGQERLHDVNVWRVRATRGDVTSEYWIEEPSFRVHMRKIKNTDIYIKIESEFDLADPGSPFPSRVVATRDSRRSNDRTTYIVKSINNGIVISKDRFNLK